jgi:hypothetical protein
MLEDILGRTACKVKLIAAVSKFHQHLGRSYTIEIRMENKKWKMTKKCKFIKRKTRKI